MKKKSIYSHLPIPKKKSKEKRDLATVVDIIKQTRQSIFQQICQQNPFIAYAVTSYSDGVICGELGDRIGFNSKRIETHLSDIGHSSCVLI